jgi:hypothetical protein
MVSIQLYGMLTYSSLGLGHGMAMSLRFLKPGSVGAWLAVPQTQTEYINLNPPRKPPSADKSKLGSDRPKHYQSD